MFFFNRLSTKSVMVWRFVDIIVPFIGPIEAAVIENWPHPNPVRASALKGVARHLAAHGHGCPSLAAGAGNLAEHPKEGWRQYVVAASNATIGPIGGENALKSPLLLIDRKLTFCANLSSYQSIAGTLIMAPENNADSGSNPRGLARAISRFT